MSNWARAMSAATIARYGARQAPKNNVLQTSMTTNGTVFSHLADRPLLDAAKQLATEERRATAALLRVLMEIDTRRLYLGESCASMFTYCRQVLHMAEGAAYNRIEAARAARRYPIILQLFEESAITLTAVRLLGPHLTEQNHIAVLTSARHKPKREIEELVVTLRPRPDALTVIKKVPAIVTVPAAPSVGSTASSGIRPSLASAPAARPTSATHPQAPRQARVITPLAPERYRMQFTVSRATHEKFRRAQALLRHALPSGDAAEIFDRALTLLLKQLERARYAETSQPRPSKSSPQKSRHIPAAVRREVWGRDDGRCAFVGPAGRCRETAFLEYHHAQPYAADGAATLENIQLRCRAHNAYEARLFFGDGVVREDRIAWDAQVMLVPDRGDLAIGTIVVPYPQQATRSRTTSGPKNRRASY